MKKHIINSITWAAFIILIVINIYMSSVIKFQADQISYQDKVHHYLEEQLFNPWVGEICFDRWITTSTLDDGWTNRCTTQRYKDRGRDLYPDNEGVMRFRLNDIQLVNETGVYIKIGDTSYYLEDVYFYYEWILFLNRCKPVFKHHYIDATRHLLYGFDTENNVAP